MSSGPQIPEGLLGRCLSTPISCRYCSSMSNEPPGQPYGQPPWQQGQWQTPAQPPYQQQQHNESHQRLPASPPASQPPDQPKGSTGKKLAAVFVGILLIAGAIVAIDALGGGDGPTVRRVDGTGEISADDPSFDLDFEDVPAGVDENVIGLDNNDLSSVTAEAVHWISDYWNTTFPEVFGEPYEPISGGIYSQSPNEELPRCLSSYEEVFQNALYCPDFDEIVWDDQALFPKIFEENGALAVAMVMAHEWGHAIQERVGMRAQSVTLETQADCYAGAWVGDVGDKSETFRSAGALDDAIAGLLTFADEPGTSARDPFAHGSAFDRVNAFQDGLENGASKCAGYNDSNINIVQLPFTSQEDYERGGDAPYDLIFEYVKTDLDDYWATVARVEDLDWTPISQYVPYDPDSEELECGSEAVNSRLFYCEADNYIGYDDGRLFPAMYDSIGDYAVGVMIATNYGGPALEAFGLDLNAKDESLASDCLAGAWSASVFKQDRTTSEFILSPGDLDEAISALLAFGDSDDEGGVGTGFERVSAFRQGVLGGYDDCLG